MDSQLVKQKLAEHQINVSVGLAKSTLLYMNKHQLQSVVRASIHYYNTEAELEQLCKAIPL
jgi:cysteine desulfurase/selenocysteine lyase